MRRVQPVGPDGQISMYSVGVIRSKVSTQQTGGFEDARTVIELDPKFADYLRGLESYSHLQVIYWMHEQLEAKAITRPQGNPSVPEVGMFACR